MQGVHMEYVLSMSGECMECRASPQITFIFCANHKPEPAVNEVNSGVDGDYKRVDSFLLILQWLSCVSVVNHSLVDKS